MLGSKTVTLGPKSGADGVVVVTCAAPTAPPAVGTADAIPVAVPVPARVDQGQRAGQQASAKPLHPLYRTPGWSQWI